MYLSSKALPDSNNIHCMLMSNNVVKFENLQLYSTLLHDEDSSIDESHMSS